MSHPMCEGCLVGKTLAPPGGRLNSKQKSNTRSRLDSNGHQLVKFVNGKALPQGQTSCKVPTVPM
eukprot:5296226-Amphidinium_carterae.1